MEAKEPEVPKRIQRGTRPSRRRDKAVRSRKVGQEPSIIPKMTTKTRFQWRYKNRACFEQMRIKHDAGRDVPVSRQTFYVTDSSEGEDIDVLGRNLMDHNVQSIPDDMDDVTEISHQPGVPVKNRSSYSGDDIEWDYSDIQLTAQKITDENQGDTAAQDATQILPNFEEFDQVELETDIFVRPPRMGTRSLRKSNDQILKLVTSFSVKPEDNLSSQSASTFRDSNQSDSGVQDVFNGTTRDDSSQEKSGNSDFLPGEESKLTDSIEVLEGLEYYSHQPENRATEVSHSIMPNTLSVMKEKLSPRKNFPDVQHQQNSNDAIICKHQRKSRSEERTSSPELDDQKQLFQAENSKDDWWKSRSQSLDVSQSSSYYDSLEGTPRSRLNWSVEHLHEGYDITCVLCKDRHNCKNHSSHKHVHTFYKEKNSGQDIKDSDKHTNLPNHGEFHESANQNRENSKHKQGISHPMGVLEREEVFIKPSSPPIEKGAIFWTDKVKDIEGNQDEKESNTIKNDRAWIRKENKHRPAAKSKFDELVKKWEGATQNPQGGLKRSLSFDGIQKSSGKLKEYIPHSHRKSVQEMSKDFAKKSMKENISRSPSKEEKCVDNLRIRSNSFTLGSTSDTPSEPKRITRTNREKPDLPMSSRSDIPKQASQKKSQNDKPKETIREIKCTASEVDKKSCPNDSNHCKMHQSNCLLKLHKEVQSFDSASFKNNEIERHNHLKVYCGGVVASDGVTENITDDVTGIERFRGEELSTEQPSKLKQIEIDKRRLLDEVVPSEHEQCQTPKPEDICHKNDHQITKLKKNIAILDFSETEPTVRFNIQDNKESKFNHIYHIVYSPTDEKTFATDQKVDRPNLKSDSEKETYQVNERMAFDVPEAESQDSSLVLSITDTSVDEEEQTLSDESVISSALPVHVYRSSCMIDKKIIGTSNMEFWYTQLLGVHRLILLARICDRFGIRRWRSRKKRHVSVFYRDNFLVVCEKSDRSGDMSREECSFDVSWSPEFMSTPRDIPSQEGEENINQYDSNRLDLLGDDSFGHIDYRTPETVKEALERIMNGKLHVKVAKKKPKRSEVEIHISNQAVSRNEQAVTDGHYSQYQRTTHGKYSGNCRTFEDLQFSSGNSEESVVEKTGDTSIWDSYLDSGYDFGRNQAHDLSQDTTGTLSDSTLLDSTLSDMSVQERANCAISEVIEKSVSPVSEETLGNGQMKLSKSKKKYATTIVILTTEASDTSMSEEEADQKMTFTSTKSKVDGRYISAFSIPSRNPDIAKGGDKKGVPSKQRRRRRRRRPKTEEIGLHRFICLDMPLKVWPVNDRVSYVLPIEHIEIDTCTNDSSRKMEPPHDKLKSSKIAQLNENLQSDIKNQHEKWESDESYDSFISSDGTITEVTPDTTSTTQNCDLNRSDEDFANSTSNESALGTSNCSEKTEPLIELRTASFRSVANVAALLTPQHGPDEEETEADVMGTEKSRPKSGNSDKRFSSCINNVVLAPCTLPLALNLHDNINSGVTSNTFPESIQWPEFHEHLIEDSFHSVQEGFCAIDKAEDQGFTELWEMKPHDVANKPPKENVPKQKKHTRVKVQFREIQNIPHLNPPDILHESTTPFFANQQWEKDQWDFHFGSCHNGPNISVPEGQRNLNTGDIQGTFVTDAGNTNTVDSLLPPLSGSRFDNQVKSSEYSNIYQSRNNIDTSLNDTYTDILEDDAYRLNKSYSQIENSTRILRVMDFAADGVDLMVLLNKVSRSQSCPELSVENFGCFGTSQVIRSESLPAKENVLNHNIELESLSFPSVVSDTLSRESPRRHSEEYLVGGDYCEMIRGDDYKFGEQGLSERQYGETDGHSVHANFGRNDEVVISHIEEKCPIQDDNHLAMIQNGLILKQQDSEDNTSVCVKQTPEIADNEQVIHKSHSPGLIQSNASTKAGSAENSFDVEEEASISVNVSFEVEFSQKMAKSDKVQNLLKDCQMLKQGLLHGVAQITQEMTRDMKESISDESLQLEWLYDEKKGCEMGKDEMIYFTLSGNKSFPGNAKQAGSSRFNSLPSKSLSKSNPELSQVVLRTLDIPYETDLIPIEIDKTGQNAPEEHIPSVNEIGGANSECDYATDDIPVRIFLEDFNSRTDGNRLAAQYVNEGDVHETWGSQTDIRVCEIDLPEQALPSQDECHTASNINPQNFNQEEIFCNITDESEFVEESASFYETGHVPLLRDICLLSLNISRSSSEESFPGLMHTSFSEKDRYLVNEFAMGQRNGSEVNLSLVSMSDLSGGTPSPRIHHIIRSQQGQRLKFVKGNLSVSDNEHINFIDFRNKAMFSLDTDSGRFCYPGHYASQSLNLTWPWLHNDYRLKRCFSADDLADYVERNYVQHDGSSHLYQEKEINANVNNNNNNENDLDIGFTGSSECQVQ